MDIFKAIFEESSASESESDSGEDQEEEHSAGVPQKPNTAAADMDTGLASSDAAVQQIDSSGSGHNHEEAGMDVCSREHPQVSQERTAAVAFGPVLPPLFNAGEIGTLSCI